MTIKELRELVLRYPDDYVVVVSKHKGEGAIIAIAPEVYKEQREKDNALHHVLPDRRMVERKEDEVGN